MGQNFEQNSKNSYFRASLLETEQTNELQRHKDVRAKWQTDVHDHTQLSCCSMILLGLVIISRKFKHIFQNIFNRQIFSNKFQISKLHSKSCKIELYIVSDIFTPANLTTNGEIIRRRKNFLHRHKNLSTNSIEFLKCCLSTTISGKWIYWSLKNINSNYYYSTQLT